MARPSYVELRKQADKQMRDSLIKLRALIKEKKNG